MALRGKLYRCHLCSYAGPQTEGVEAFWAQGLIPVGDRRLDSMEMVELVVMMRDSDLMPDVNTPIRFDILEEDFLLTGGSDDRVVSILGSGASPSAEPFPKIEHRINRTWILGPTDTLEDTVARFVEQHPTDYADYLLILNDPLEADLYYLVTWWKAAYLDDVVGDSEFYFIVNVGDAFEDQSQPVLNVQEKQAAHAVPPGLPDMADEQVEDVRGDTGEEDDALPPPKENAVDEPLFREAAAQIVRGSGILDLISETGTQDLSPTPPVSVIPSPGIGVAPPADDSGLVFPPLEIIAGEELNNLETPPEEEDLYGTGWPFLHWDDEPKQDQVISGASGFSNQTLIILPDWSWIAVDPEGSRYVIAYQLTRAIQWGKALFGPQSFAVIESPLYSPGQRFKHGPPRYYVVPTWQYYMTPPLPGAQKKPFSVAELEGQPAVDATGTFQFKEVRVRYWQLLPTDKKTDLAGILRVIGTADDLFFWPRVGFVESELFRQLREEGMDPSGALPMDPQLKDRIVATVFPPIDTALVTADEDRVEALLLALDHNAFDLVGPEKRFKYLEFLIGHFGILGDEKLDKAIFEILKAVESRVELDRIRDKLGKEKMARLVRNLDSNLWSLLTMLGKKLAKELPPQEFNLEFFLEILQLGTLGTDSKEPKKILGAVSRLSWGPTGLLFTSEYLEDLRQGALSLVRFIPNAIKDLFHLITNPQQLIDAVGQLMKLAIAIDLARIPLPDKKEDEPAWLTRVRVERDKARQTLKGLFEGLREGFRDGYRAAKELGVTKDVLRRVKWTILWEVLSLFIGVGEIKAAFNLARIGIEAASIAVLAEKLTLTERGVEFFRVFSRVLSRESRLIAAEEEAARALSRLPVEDLRVTESALTKVEAEGAQTFEQLLAKDAGAAKILVGARQEVEAMAVLIRKSGGAATEAIEKAFARLRSSVRLSERDLLAIMEALPEGEGARFAEAVNALSEEALTGAKAYTTSEFFKQLASRPEWTKAIIKNEKAFGAIYRHAGGDTAKVDTMLSTLDDLGRELKYDAKAIEAVIRDVENGEAKALKRLTEGPKVLKPQVKPPAEPPRKVPPSGGEIPPSPPPTAKAPPDPPPGVNEQIYDLFNRDVAFYQQKFDAPMREAVDAAVKAERGTFCSVVTELAEDAYTRRKVQFLERLANEGATEAELKNVEKALDALNAEFKSRATRAVEHLTPDDITRRMSGLKKYQDAARIRRREIEQRIKEYGKRARSRFSTPEEKARAADRVRALKNELEELKAWIKDGAVRRKELEDLAKTVQDSLFLRDRLANGGEKMLYRLWVDMKFRPRGRPPVKSPFERYVRRRMGEFRGLSGEMDLAFQLGPEFDLLKAPDRFVTRKGIDLIALRRSDKMLGILDNKSSVRKLLKDVSALTRNLVTNLREDVREFRLLAKRFTDVPPDFIGAADRMERAANDIEKVLARVPPGQPMPIEAQEEIAAILKKNNIRLLVTNVGGQTETLAPELGKYIQFWDVQKPGELPPVPPLPP